MPEQFQRFAVRIGTNWDVMLHGARARLIDGCGLGSKKATEAFVEWVKKYDPDVIHLHNIHGYYINIEVLFGYLKDCKKKILWTLHDCWAFTGHCTHFDYVGCEQWTSSCNNCPQKKEYPACNGLSRAKFNFVRKKDLFTGISNLTLVTPSDWLARLVRRSFLHEYPIVTIHNGIDIDIFKATPSDIVQQYGLDGKKIVLGVAAIWNRKKGLDYLVQLADKLDSTYAVAIIGVTKKQRKRLPTKVLGISQTNSPKTLAEWYTAAEVYVNPTLEDNYPTTNLEAIACGTPIITFDTGGCSEVFKDNSCGTISKKDIDSLFSTIISEHGVKRENMKINRYLLSKERAVDNYMTLLENSSKISMKDVEIANLNVTGANGIVGISDIGDVSIGDLNVTGGHKAIIFYQLLSEAVAA